MLWTTYVHTLLKLEKIIVIPKPFKPVHLPSKLLTDLLVNSLNIIWLQISSFRIIRTDLLLKTCPFGMQLKKSLSTNQAPIQYKNLITPGHKVMSIKQNFSNLLIRPEIIEQHSLKCINDDLSIPLQLSPHPLRLSMRQILYLNHSPPSI